MRKTKTKSIKFASLLRESVLFSEHEVEGILSRCGSDRTIPAVIVACDDLQIGLTPEDVGQLCHMTLKVRSAG